MGCRVVLLNFANPEPDELGRGTRWWHKSGSRWPATILERRTDGSEYLPWPFLLCYLAELLRTDGHEVALLDGCAQLWTLDDALHAVTRQHPDYIVFETAEQCEHDDRRIVSALGEQAPVVLIGPSVAEDRLDLLDWPGCFAAVPGEYLLSVRDWMRDPHAGMAQRQEVLGNAMDALPFAYRDPEITPRYNARFKTTPPGCQGQFVSMWGCQYRCRFCIWVHSYWARSSQFKKHFSIERLEAELEWFQRSSPGITSLYDDSDNHHYRGADAVRFAEMMARRNVPWAILTRADTYMTKNEEIDRDMWQLYRDCGMHAVKIGVEGVQETMDASNKRLSEDVVRSFVPFMQDMGVSVYCSFMLDVPGTSPETDQATQRMIADLAAYRPSLFEYFVSRCDITRTTPFGAQQTGRGSDGQLGVERLEHGGRLTLGGVAVPPNNL